MAQKPYIAPELRPYVAEYMMVMTQQPVSIRQLWSADSILLVDTNKIICSDSTAVGCTEFFRKVITIKRPAKTEQYVDAYYKATMYHELGHWIFDLPDEQGQGSLMCGVFNHDSEFFEHNWDAYVLQYNDLIKAWLGFKKLSDKYYQTGWLKL